MKKILAIVLALVMAMSMTTVAMAEGEATLTTNIGEKTFFAGASDWVEFTFSTVKGNTPDNTMVYGGSDFGVTYETKIAALEYKYGEGQWADMKGQNFGGSDGFPMADATSTFRVKFTQDAAGNYTFTAAMRKVDGGDVLCSVVVPFTVYEADAVVDESTFKTALSNGGPINLAKDITLTEKVTISQDITLNGNGHTITGVANSTDVYFEVTNGTFTLEDVTLTDFGKTAGTNSGVAVIKVPSGSSGAKVVATDVTVKDFCRSAFDLRAGEFILTDCTINCNNGASQALSKAVLVGLGSTKTTGTITGCTITGSNSTYDDWDSAGVEIYGPSDVTVKNTAITSMSDGVTVDRYFSTAPATVTLENCTVTTTNNAVEIYQSYGDSVPNANATVNLNIKSGSYSGAVVVTRAAGTEIDTASKIAISGGTFTDKANAEKFLTSGLKLNSSGTVVSATTTSPSGSYTPSGHYVTSPFDGVDKVYVDGKLVDAKNYAVSGGNVTLLQSYLDGLTNGKHNIKIVYGAREATGTFEVSGNKQTVESAKTFDAGIALYAGMALMSAAGAAYVEKKRH